MCLNWRRIALYAILLIFLSALFVFCLMMPWFVYMGCFLERYASLDYHTYRTAYWITLIILLLLYTALTYSGVLCAKRISRLLMGNYSGRIVALGTDVLLMAISFVLVIVCERMAHTNLIDILVVLLVVRFLYDLNRLKLILSVRNLKEKKNDSKRIYCYWNNDIVGMLGTVS